MNAKDQHQQLIALIVKGILNKSQTGWYCKQKSLEN